MQPVSTPTNTYSRPLCVLSIDGGGIRGIIPLLILREIMQEVSDLVGESLKPCEVFDLIGGTSAGGLISLMLGRMGMSVDECIQKFKTFSRDIFNQPRLQTAGHFFWNTNFYDEANLETALKCVVGETLMEDKEPNHCSTFVVAVAAAAVNDPAGVIFRTYASPTLDDIGPSCQTTYVWQAARATSAAPSYFAPFELDGRFYSDGGLGHNNPVFHALREAEYLTSSTRQPIGCLVSLGTGNSGSMILKIAGPFLRNIFRVGRLKRSMIAMVTDTEKSHRDMKSLAKHGKVKYFRFNPALTSIDKYPLDAWRGIDDLEEEISGINGHISEMRNEIRDCARVLYQRSRIVRVDSQSRSIVNLDSPYRESPSSLSDPTFSDLPRVIAVATRNQWPLRRVDVDYARQFLTLDFSPPSGQEGTRHGHERSSNLDPPSAHDSDDQH